MQPVGAADTITTDELSEPSEFSPPVNDTSNDDTSDKEEGSDKEEELTIEGMVDDATQRVYLPMVSR